MQKMTLIFLLNFALSGCGSNVTKNLQHSSPFLLQGGTIHGKNINENLNFTRTSLTQELNLLMDVFVLRLKSIGAFNGWMSEGEKGIVNSCKHPLYFLIYTFDDSRLRSGMIAAQMQALGFKQISLPQFRENLVVHPGYVENALKFYKHHVFCGAGDQKSPIVLELPGFKTVEISLEN